MNFITEITLPKTVVNVTPYLNPGAKEQLKENAGYHAEVEV